LYRIAGSFPQQVLGNQAIDLAPGVLLGVGALSHVLGRFAADVAIFVEELITESVPRWLDDDRSAPIDDPYFRWERERHDLRSCVILAAPESQLAPHFDAIH
jgi:hypothetical protein